MEMRAKTKIIEVHTTKYLLIPSKVFKAIGINAKRKSIDIKVIKIGRRVSFEMRV